MNGHFNIFDAFLAGDIESASSYTGIMVGIVIYI